MIITIIIITIIIIIIIVITILMGAYISIFPDQFRAPQGWKRWRLLPVGKPPAYYVLVLVLVWYVAGAKFGYRRDGSVLLTCITSAVLWIRIWTFGICRWLDLDLSQERANRSTRRKTPTTSPKSLSHTIVEVKIHHPNRGSNPRPLNVGDKFAWRTLIGAVPIRCHHGSKRRELELNKHNHVDRTHSLTHQHSYNHIVRSVSSAITEFGIEF